MTCKRGVPTQDGSKYSSMRITNSSTGKAVKSLTLKEARTKKAKLLVCGEITEERANNGKLFILINQRKKQPKD